ITLNFGMKATDADGDTTNGTILVRVLDDAPVVVNDTISLPSTSGFFSANVLSNDRAGIDGATLVTKVTLNGVDHQIAPTGSTTISGQHGTLVMRADGYYTYSPTAAGVDHFTYTVVDRDGDRSSASLDFDIFDIKSKVVVDLNVNNGVESVCIKEDTSIIVPVKANVTGGDGDEVITLTVTGVGANWGFLGTGWSQVSPGVYSIALPVGQTNYNGSFKLTPPLNSDVDLNGLKITASVFDPDFGASEINQKNFNISVDAVADIPTVSVNLPAYVNHNPFVNTPYYNYQYYGQNEAKDFNISAILSDKDGSEKITHYTIEMHKTLADMGIKFSAGTEISHGLWRIEAGQEIGLKIIFPDLNQFDSSMYFGMQGIHTMNVTAYVSEINLSGNECDTTDNTSLNCVPIQVVILASPLAVDLNGDGVHLTDANNGVYFDINGDGISDKTGWVDQNDGLLALDKDHNGLIEGQGELFGGNIEDGFSVLARYDDNTDGVIDQNDSVWKDLVIWQDANHDGVSQNGELISLDDLDFSSISLNSQSVEYYVSGNKISAESTITKSDGTSTQIVDAWFAFYNGADADQMAEAKSNESSQSALAFNQESHNTQPVVIADFDSQVDKIDLSSLIDTGSVVGDAINDFVFSRTENGSTIISVDASGSGSASAAVDVVVLKDVIINHVDDIVEIAHQQQQQSGFGTV
ncbi:MAG: type I secretion C-terminal target domain-containing protein, partial [Alphaproteobacteria bacterium]|nr:type I secretion C-terminal target domain-containing protein [Alphaproteobacteria bacterium]